MRSSRNDPGFTLVELLVVVVIIGILAAIAFPVFANQRKKGWDAAAKSDVRNGASYQESYLADHGGYADTFQLLAAGWTPSDEVTNLTVVSGAGGASGFILGVLSRSGTVWCYDPVRTGRVYEGSGPGPSGGAPTGGITPAMCP